MHRRAPPRSGAETPAVVCQSLLPVPWRSGLIALSAALALSACGSQVHSAAPAAAASAAALKGSPPPLAALHAQGGKLLAGGLPAFRTRLTALRGYPVVINKWASWCGPCQSEVPLFQRAAVRYGRRVAFVGIDGNDHEQAARSFLRSYPLTYPSFSDPAQRISASVHAASYFPQTVFLAPSGKLRFVHIGAYANERALAQDIARYALAPS